MDFNEANKKVHPVETQWHYDGLIAAGFEAKTPTAIGFVRSYDYEHPTTGEKITCTTGSRADYWRSDRDAGGYWGELISYLAIEYPPTQS